MDKFTLALLILLFLMVFYNKSDQLLPTSVLSIQFLLPIKGFFDEHGMLVLYLVLFFIFIIVYASMNKYSFKDKKGEKWIRKIGTVKV